LFIDELHTLVVRAGAPKGLRMECEAICEAGVWSRRSRAIGATTLNEYRKYTRIFLLFDAAVAAGWFQIVFVGEPMSRIRCDSARTEEKV